MRTLRRFPQAPAIGAFLACVSCLCQAAYLESDGYEPPPSEPVRPPRYVPPPPPAGNAIARLLGDVDVGAPIHYRGLAVYPLYLRYSDWGSAICTLDEAVNRRWIVIEEKGAAEVGWVRVRNGSDRLVLVMTGEILVGGKQNRVVRDDVLVAPRSSVDVSVYCGEQRRWSEGAAAFDSRSSLAQPGLRAMAAKGAQQGDVWREIDEQAGRAEVASPTRDYQSIYESRRVAGALSEYADRIRCPSRNVVGLVAVSGGRILGADVFMSARLLNEYWGKLVRSYGMDVLHVGERRGHASDWEVRRYLGAAVSGYYSERGTPGVGRLWSISGATDGIGLEYEGRAVHAHLLEGSGPVTEPPPPPPPPPDPYPPIRPMPHLWR